MLELYQNDVAQALAPALTPALTASLTYKVKNTKFDIIFGFFHCIG
jgi:hypothetical protein